MKTKVRVDAQYLLENADLNQILKGLSKSYPETGILVMERKPKLHYHAYIDSDVSLPTLRKKLNENLSSTGNEAKSVSNSHHDWDVYKGYLFKHDDTTVIHVGTDYDKDELIKSYKGHIKQSNEGEYKEQPNSIVVQLESYLKDKPWETIKELASLIVDYHTERKKLLDKHYIGKLITTMYVNSGKGKTRFIEDVIFQETPFSDTYERESGRVEKCKFCKDTQP